MTEIKKDKLCFYCMGCNKEEIELFNGVRNCKNFAPTIGNWQEFMRRELKIGKI